MIVIGIAILLALAAIVAFMRARHAFFWDRHVAGVLLGLIGLACIALSAALGFFAFTLRTYEQVPQDEHVADVQVVRHGDRQYTAMFTYPGNRLQTFDLRGDDWQVAARLLAWRDAAQRVGLPTRYRLQRVSSRFRKPEEDRAAPRTETVLAAPERFDTWEMLRRWSGVPAVHAFESASEVVPLADGALYEVVATPDGMAARAKNDVARKAISEAAKANPAPAAPAPEPAPPAPESAKPATEGGSAPTQPAKAPS